MIFTKNEVSKSNLISEMQHISERLSIENIEKALYFPKYFEMETTRICNAKCSFCPIEQSDGSFPYISDKLFDKIVSEFKNYTDWIETITITRIGEPLIDNNIYSRINKLKQIGIKKVTMSTNASLLNEDRAKKLINSGLDEITFSIESLNKTKYEQMRKGLNFETVIDNIKGFFNLRNLISPKFSIRIRGIIWPESENEVNSDGKANSSSKSEQNISIPQEWRIFFKDLLKTQDTIYVKKAHTWANQKILSKNNIELDGKIPESNWVYHPCIIPWSTMNITTSGKVALCSHDFDAKTDIGDINNSSIQEVWKNTNYSKIRELHQTGNRNQIEFCQGCRNWDLDIRCF